MDAFIDYWSSFCYVSKVPQSGSIITFNKATRDPVDNGDRVTNRLLSPAYDAASGTFTVEYSGTYIFIISTGVDTSTEPRDPIIVNLEHKDSSSVKKQNFRLIKYPNVNYGVVTLSRTVMIDLRAREKVSFVQRTESSKTSYSSPEQVTLSFCGFRMSSY